MKLLRSTLPFVTLLAPALVQAGTSYQLTIDATKAKASQASKIANDEACELKATATAETQDRLAVQLSGKLRFALSISVAGQTQSMTAGQTEVAFEPAAMATDKLLVTSQGSLICARALAPAKAPEPTLAPAPPEPRAVTREDTSFVALDEGARAFLLEKQITDHELVRDSVNGRILRLFHLPSGTPAFPIPRHLDEKDEVELWLVLPAGATAKVDVTACEDAPAVRVAGTYKSAKAALEKLALQSGETKEAGLTQALQYRLEPHAKRLSCAGTLTYQIDVKRGGEQASTPTSIAFDPVYRFEWGLGYMFDFAKRSSFSLADRPAGDGSEKFLVRSRDTAGAAPVIALGVNVCGTNPKRLTWCDRLLNPTLIIDPTRLTSGFGLGLSFRPFHGLGLLAGVTVFENTVLADGVTAKPGEAWTIAGDPPTKQVFDRDSVGFVLAAVISTDVLAALSRSDD